MTRIRVLVFTVGLILVAGPICAQAGMAVDFAAPGLDVTTGNWSLGWAFTVNQPMIVQSLGFYDDQKNGLIQVHDVGIFNAAQQLIVFGQVTPSDPLVSWWRWTNVTPTLLVPQELYQIGAVTGAENYSGLPVGFVVDPQVNYLLDSYFNPPNGVLTYPNTSQGVVGDFGPNFSTDAVPVPAPGALLLLVPGLVSVLGLRRRFL
jgi:hypothetical protein